MLLQPPTPLPRSLEDGTVLPPVIKLIPVCALAPRNRTAQIDFVTGREKSSSREVHVACEVLNGEGQCGNFQRAKEPVRPPETALVADTAGEGALARRARWTDKLWAVVFVAYALIIGAYLLGLGPIASTAAACLCAGSGLLLVQLRNEDGESS